MTRRQAPDPVITATCEGCIQQFQTPTRWNEPPARFCSLLCREYVRHGKAWVCELPATHAARPPKPPRTPAPDPARWVGRTCTDCGATFITPNHGQQDIYCSMRCTRRVNKRIRKARAHGAGGTFSYTEVMRIYLKQGKTCAYCRQPVHGLPEPEHVVPLSRGGRNDTTNLVAACHACNADKGDMTPHEWAVSRRARGLEARHTDLVGPEFKHLMLVSARGRSPRAAA